MDKYELEAILTAHRDNALGSEDSELSNERATALDHYYGRPYGNEEDGRSKVVSKDLSETVDWILPGLLRVFTQSGNIAEFDPVGPDDEEGSQQESDYINHVFMVENNGVLNLYDAFKDGLILKNYYFKWYVDESEKIREPEYTGLTDNELAYMVAKLEQEGEVDIAEHDEREEFIQGVPIIVHDVKFKIKAKDKKYRVEVCPPEEIRVSKRCRGKLQETPYIEHRPRGVTRSDLIEMGLPKKWVNDLSAVDQDENDDEEYSRDTVSEESDDLNAVSYDHSMDEIDYAEIWCRVDYDEDGIAELRKIITCNDKIPPGSEWNEIVDSIPFASGSPKRVPHRHIGESIDDELAELQEIKTVLTRQMLDNVYAVNNHQWIANERVHMPDLLQSLPGGVKRVLDDEPVDGCLRAVETRPIVADILPAIDHVDQMKQNRSGVNETTTNIDPDVLKNANNKAYMEGMSKASQKVEMIARLFAEGVKECLLGLHELLLKHQDKEKIVKLRGKFVPVDPTQWRERTDMRLKVGLGTGSEEERKQRLAVLAELQESLKEYGLVGPQHKHALFTDMAKALGNDMPEKYAFDPRSQEYQQMMAQKQDQPNPLAEVEQVKGQFSLQKAQMEQEFKGQIEQLKMRQENEREMFKQQLEAVKNDAERQSKEAIEAAKLEMKALIEGFKIDIGEPGIGAGLQDDT